MVCRMIEMTALSSITTKILSVSGFDVKTLVHLVSVSKRIVFILFLRIGRVIFGWWRRRSSGWL